ncbi:hypothetical protein EDB80DRAFT_595608 [Ilyonectria destructans]|nr:hypothetical protein EDB80DRAFT_595608 [Ilyonectria destructans]
MSSKASVQNPLLHPLLFLYQLLQWLTDKLLSPQSPLSNSNLRRPNIAAISAGITGVTSAAHCIGHGFDVIFEGGLKDQVGGIWTVLNETSGLQIHSLMYRFHPSNRWDRGYPNRQEILSQVQQLWHRLRNRSTNRFDRRSGGKSERCRVYRPGYCVRVDPNT